MTQRFRSLTPVVCLLLSFFVFITHHSLHAETNLSGQGKAYLLSIDGAISPGTADYLIRGIKKANEDNARIVLIRMDTPGGLDKAMRNIIKTIIASNVPVISYVSPSGARAASAGTYISYASHIAAMAPATNLGSATPVSIGGGGGLPGEQPVKEDEKKEEKSQEKKDAKKQDAKGKQREKAEKSQDMPKDAMKSKVVNDAAAYIEGLAKLHNRNAEWAVKAVREAASLSSEEALAKKVIDIVATDVNDLLKQMQGRIVKVNGKPVVLDVENLTFVDIEPDWRNKILTVITDPSVAYILLMLGIYGIFFEFANPGFVVPGVVGAISIILAMYALQMLPINYAGLGLIVLGIIFMLAEVFVPSFGALGFGGIIAFVLGSVLMFDTDVPGVTVSWQLIGFVALLNALFFFGILSLAIRGQRKAIVSGQEAMINSEATALEDIPAGKTGQVRVSGEIWRAKHVEPDVMIERDQTVTVVEIKGLICIVK